MIGETDLGGYGSNGIVVDNPKVVHAREAALDIHPVVPFKSCRFYDRSFPWEPMFLTGFEANGAGGVVAGGQEITRRDLEQVTVGPSLPAFSHQPH